MTEVFRVKARKVVGGTAEGEALIADAKLSFWGEYDPITGKVILPGHPFFQKDLSSKIVIIREIKGSSSCEMALRLGKMLGKAPAGMININIECLAVLGCVVAKIPLMTDLDQDPFKVISTGDLVKIRADEGIVEVCKRPFAVSQ